MVCKISYSPPYKYSGGRLCSACPCSRETVYQAVLPGTAAPVVPKQVCVPHVGLHHVPPVHRCEGIHVIEGSGFCLWVEGTGIVCGCGSGETWWCPFLSASGGVQRPSGHAAHSSNAPAQSVA
jgi:hypothetical protein